MGVSHLGFYKQAILYLLSLLQWQIFPFQALTVTGLGLGRNWPRLNLLKDSFSLSFLSCQPFKGGSIVPQIAIGEFIRG